MIDIPTGLPSEIVPLSWLIGVWEGTGVIDYTIGDEKVTHEFGQRVSFSNDGLPYLNYSSYAWLLDDKLTPLVSELGYWRLSRPVAPGDQGPGMLPGSDPRPYSSTNAVESLRNANDGFDIEVSLLHPGGVDELYIGQVKAARIDLATDAVMRSHSAKEYTAATRLYGLVSNDLLWAWDIAALGQDLRTHASARLVKTD
ncbi:FABP family protein [Subtercola boreus]|uniref:Peroxynitrite isomerase n=1 Tax=Subtercola boreus TaxID=120213 RepID=A0A3E0WAU3_9MICO|nr:FABP family protein [Subtercola boreus]RFA19338.1 FABP family protein [Subtercola boreus]RFA19599.1 FABP family protein [Subtercola boreus]RFA25964.1 FABP family protein [Subtercola boreus]